MSSAIPLARITRNFAIASKSYITQEINFTCFCIESGESDKRNYRNRYEDLKGFIRFQLNGNDPEMACYYLIHSPLSMQQTEDLFLVHRLSFSCFEKKMQLTNNQIRLV